MAYQSYRTSDNTAPYYADLIADLLSDVETLPTFYAPGSTCLVLEDFSVYILGVDETWHKAE